ncbi:hypothetical protein [Umezawaea sp. NPDC059074]|uniref:hypothetical protein n=1 Tax=Umezawaea sp. NPDC059074 TaxID=3346716 RepID=UPI0036A743DB
MTARGGLGKAFAAAVGEWAAASERVVRPVKAAAEPAPLVGRSADLPVVEPTGRLSGVLDGAGDSAPEQSAVRP